MTKKEIDTLIEQGEKLEKFFGIKKISYFLAGKVITEKQFNSAKERFKFMLDYKQNSRGFSTYIYTLKK